MNLRYTLLIALFSATISFAQSEFITVWETTTDGESITIPISVFLITANGRLRNKPHFS